MTATVAAAYTAVGRSIRRAGSAFALDLPKRVLQQTYRVWTRATGHVPTGFSADVGGHDHSGVGAGLPMPRNLGCTIRQDYRDRNADGYMVKGGQPIATISLRPAGTQSHGANWFNFFSTLTVGGGINFAPVFRRVKVSPGINWVGAQITAHVAIFPDETIASAVAGVNPFASVPAGDVRLTSAPSANTADDVDGTTNAYTKTQTGEAISFKAGSIVTLNSTYALLRGKPLRIWCGQPIRPALGAPYKSSLRGGGESLAQSILGAVRVSPGAYNDINIEFKAARRDAAIFVYALRLFEIDAPTTAVYG